LSSSLPSDGQVRVLGEKSVGQWDPIISCPRAWCMSPSCERASQPASQPLAFTVLGARTARFVALYLACSPHGTM
jgi:hypothetical protein